MLSVRAFDVIAMGSPGQANVLAQMIPFILILAIFYFLILLPMKRRQKKIQEFQDSLKVGDKVVTTGGLYGKITRVTERTLQLEIADRVRVEVARASIGGYQGQEPVVSESGSA
jgi:preprotein translocase subunit YajC